MSSMHSAVCENSSETSMPDCPYFLKENGLFKNVPGFGKKGVMFRLAGGASRWRLVQFWLGIKRVQMTGAAVHEQRDDCFGFGRKMRFLGKQRGIGRERSKPAVGLASEGRIRPSWQCRRPIPIESVVLIRRSYVFPLKRRNDPQGQSSERRNDECQSTNDERAWSRNQTSSGHSPLVILRH